MLGAGFFGFFAHTGVLAALEAQGLRPRRLVGVSAGALAGGIWAAGVDASALELEFLGLTRQDFWDPGLPWGGMLRGDKFARRLQTVLGQVGVGEFRECSTPLAVVVHDVLRRRATVIADGPLVPAIRASCTVPLLFRPVRIDGRWVVDGGVSDRAGLSAVRPDERVLVHHLASQSPWRGLARRTQQTVPSFAGAMHLHIPGLPRVTPFALEPGKLALEHAREFVTHWLSERVPSPFSSG